MMSECKHEYGEYGLCNHCHMTKADVLETAIKELDDYLNETPVHVDFQVMARIKAVVNLVASE